MSKGKYGSGHIFMPDNSGILRPHRQGPGQGLYGGGAAAAAVRYDNSAAKLWYKAAEAADPFTNSGSGGVRDLPYAGGWCDGPATFGQPGLFAPDTAVLFDAVFAHTSYLLQCDDSAWFGANATVWCWVTPTGAYHGFPGYLFGRLLNGDYLGPFNLCLSNAGSLQLMWQTNLYGQGATSTAAGAVSFGSPHLLAGTYDGNDTRVYVDGVQQATQHLPGGLLVDAATSRWIVGDPEFGHGGYCHEGGTIHECGFDTTVFSAAKLLAMKTAAGI